MQLPGRTTKLESEIADRREFHNGSVNAFNTRIQEMPDAILPGSMNFHPRQMFQVASGEQEPVNVSFAEMFH
jgi:LemA protein